MKILKADISRVFGNKTYTVNEVKIYLDGKYKKIQDAEKAIDQYGSKDL